MDLQHEEVATAVGTRWSFSRVYIFGEHRPHDETNHKDTKDEKTNQAYGKQGVVSANNTETSFSVRTL